MTGTTATVEGICELHGLPTQVGIGFMAHVCLMEYRKQKQSEVRDVTGEITRRYALRKHGVCRFASIQQQHHFATTPQIGDTL